MLCIHSTNWKPVEYMCYLQVQLRSRFSLQRAKLRAPAKNQRGFAAWLDRSQRGQHPLTHHRHYRAHSHIAVPERVDPIATAKGKGSTEPIGRAVAIASASGGFSLLAEAKWSGIPMVRGTWRFSSRRITSRVAAPAPPRNTLLRPDSALPVAIHPLRHPLLPLLILIRL